jgi:RimJ/RimL family protein N-acetyltransferase
VKRALRWIAHRLFADYSAYRIYCAPEGGEEQPRLPRGVEFSRLDEQLLRVAKEHSSPAVRRTARHGDGQALGFALTRAGALLSLVFYAGRDAYYGDSVWTLEDEDAALLEILTVEEFRGEGLAPLLIRLSSHAMRDAGKKRLICWIWWSHLSSQRAFEKAGWRRIGFTASVKLHGLRSPLVWRKTTGPDRAPHREG